MFNDSSHERTSSIFWFTFIYIFLITITIIVYAFEYLKQPHKRRIRSKYARVVAARKIKKKCIIASQRQPSRLSLKQRHTHTFRTRTHRYTACIFKNEISSTHWHNKALLPCMNAHDRISHWLSQELSCQCLSDKWKTIHVVKKKQLCHWTMTIMFDL